MTELVPAREIKIGDVLVTAENKLPRTVTALRPVLTTSAGRLRKLPPTQVEIISADEQRELYSDAVFLGSLVRRRLQS